MKRLDPTAKINTKYCIPLWLRNEQIMQSIKRVKGRIEAYPEGETRSDPIAIVCYGPSLNDTWEQVRDFKYVMSCSGSHKFLIERGLIPTWHVEVDPREHKCTLIGPPHPDVEYLIASTCHPKVFDMLEGYNVKLWHVFDNDEEGQRILPPGEWAVTGGCNVGLRAMSNARLLGFTQLHIFGMDGSEGASGKHAAVHPNQPKDSVEVEWNGRVFRTTQTYFEAARQTWHELDAMPDVTAKFYGDGLVQEMAKSYTRKTVGKRLTIAAQKYALISPEYRELQMKMHERELGYGVGGGQHAKNVVAVAKSMNTTSILDYGCGKGYLGKALQFPIWEYDPAIPEKSATPRPADLVVCTDVMEHIEPDKLEVVLDDIRRCTLKVVYFVIHTGAARKTLPDGRNTHLIQKPKKWWVKRIGHFFEIGHTFDTPPHIQILGRPRAEFFKGLVSNKGMKKAKS